MRSMAVDGGALHELMSLRMRVEAASQSRQWQRTRRRKGWCLRRRSTRFSCWARGSAASWSTVTTAAGDKHSSAFPG
jgi:hypothetical protein